jgi:hypothetical protein
MLLFDDDLPVMKIEYKNDVRIVMNVNYEGQEKFLVVLFRCCMYCKISPHQNESSTDISTGIAIKFGCDKFLETSQ